ncbi:hypothetical protein [Natronorubrum halophilum]|uniref:hypothetical protein n=1 Tax=Natronorubrum halophilum TaxID=1702106 RepID=UPI0010C160A4|nr:hypothetical protein [Natronorubrum halophilum]
MGQGADEGSETAKRPAQFGRERLSSVGDRRERQEFERASGPSRNRQIPLEAPAEQSVETGDGSVAEFSTDDSNPPWLITKIGQLGVYLAVAAVVLTVGALVTALLGLGVFANIVLVLSLFLVTIAMVLGTVYQVSIGGLPS